MNRGNELQLSNLNTALPSWLHVSLPITRWSMYQYKIPKPDIGRKFRISLIMYHILWLQRGPWFISFVVSCFLQLFRSFDFDLEDVSNTQYNIFITIPNFSCFLKGHPTDYSVPYCIFSSLLGVWKFSQQMTHLTDAQSKSLYFFFSIRCFFYK